MTVEVSSLIIFLLVTLIICHPYGRRNIRGSSLIGFFTFYRLSRYLNITKTSSILASSVFTVFYSTTHTGHAQLLLVGMSPLLMYLAAKSFNNFNKTKFYKYAALSSLTYGAMALTGFYVTYFTTLYLIVFSLIYLCINRRAVEFLFTKQSIKKIIIWSTFAVLSLIPFLVVYLQKLKETGGHPYSEIKKHLPKLQDIVNIGDHSLLWGSSLTELLTGSRFQFSEGELKLGFGLVFFICFIFASLYILIKYTNNIDDKKEAKWVAIAISTIILIFSVIDFGIGSLWKNVYSYVPGGKGLRVVSRIYIFLSLPATLVIFKVIDDLLKASGTIHKNISLALVVLFIFIEQINTAPFVALDAKEQFSFLKELPIPPQECKVFYAKNPSGFSFDDPNVDSYYRVNVRAMLVSSFFNIPTIIGVASFAPPDWNFTYDPPGTFDERVLKYAQKHDIHKDLCVLDITNKSWSKI